MEIDEKGAELLRRFVPEPLLTRAVIAGSWAVNPEKACDVDIWILQANHFDVAALKTMDGSSEQGGLSDVPKGVWYRQITWIKDFPLSLHTLLTTFDTVDELLDSFDLSCSAKAIDFQGKVIKGSKFIDPVIFREIIVLRCTTPMQTLRRYSRMCSRYGVKEDLTVRDMLDSGGIIQ